MASNRRLVLAMALGLATLSTACARQPAAVDAAGNPLEPLSITTASGKHDFMVEISDDEPERQRGLMFREALADDRGMLFQFPDETERAFWMRNTPNSLDIIYIDAGGRIVSIAAHTTPYSDTTLPSNGAAKGVLELRAGRSQEIGARPGDQISHPFFGR